MKLWLKLTILFTVIINLVIQLTLIIILPNIKENSYQLIGEKLKSIAVAASISINGDEYQNINFDDSLAYQEIVFNSIREKLIHLKTSLNIREDIYTLNPVSKDSAMFGVMTNHKLFSGEKFLLTHPAAKKALLDAYKNDVCSYTDVYEDQFGKWISGLAPIKNSRNNIVGVVQVDHSAKTVSDKISFIENFILWIRLILVPLTLLAGVLIARYFSSPIERIVQIINKIANGNYSENPRTKSSGEIKELFDSAENLRLTILEQQEIIFHTISELKTAKNKAEAISRMKSEFLAMISHEIRTPLNIILGNLEVLKYEFEGEKLKEVEEITDSVKHGSNRLIRTVEMIVLYSELASGSFATKARFVNVNDLFFSLIDNYKNIAGEKKLAIKTDCSATTGTIKADERLLEESLNHIIDNAFKFTSNGAIAFCIKKSVEGIDISVEDTGIGISKEFMDDIFKPFHQEDMRISRGFEGNGLGLAIAKKCCDANGFELKIESEKNKGTIVVIHVPKEKLFNENLI